MILKKSLLFLLLVLITSLAEARQVNPQAVFDRANELLQKGKVVQALDQYQQLVETEYYSGGLFFNMGYSYLQLGKPGKAKYYFLKAARFEETEEKAQAALNYVESKLSQQSVVLPALPWEKALNWLQTGPGAALLLVIGLTLLNAGIFILIGSWFKKKSKSFVPKAAITIAALGVTTVLLSFYIHYRQERFSKAVMVTRQANVLKKPAADAVLVNKAYEGYTFTVDHQKSKNRNDWVHVQMSNGSRGWIRREEIMIL